MDNNKRRIASLALFRNLYNEGRSDVMTILCEFAKSIIYNNHLTVCTPTQIKNILKDEFEFKIPEYVVETILKKICRKDNYKYYPKEDNTLQKVNDQEIKKIETSHEVVFLELVSYVEKKTSNKLTNEDKENLFQSFCGFLIDENDVKYGNYISSFIIETQNDPKLSALLKTIKEGVVLYTGIQYNDNLNEIGSWNDEFIVFVEQEILFHMAGYNGELYQQLFNDFFELVKEINQKAHKQLIKIMYFDLVKYEIDKFFNIAERIVDGKDNLDYSNIAMTFIVQGCEHKTDVISKKVAFYNLLKKNSIFEENGDNLFKTNSNYNIYYDENLNNLSNDLPQRNIDWSLKLLNYVSMIRKDNVSGFEKSKCILLTGNSTTMAVAFHPGIKQNGNVPLATTLDYITNKLWFKLNKGFGGDKYPKSFNIVTKAQIVLSTQIVGSVSQEYEKIKQEIAEKAKSEEIIIAELAELRTKVRKPEEVSDLNIDETLETITMADTERYLREREMERRKAEEQKEENERLQKEVEKKNQEKTDLETKKNDQIKQKEFEKNQLSNLLNESKLKEKNRIKDQIDDINKRKNKADKKVGNRIKKLKWVPFTIMFIVLIIIIGCICLYGWDKMEPYTWIIAALIACAPYFVFGLGFNAWNPQKLISVWYKERYEKKLYDEYEVDIIKLKKLTDDYSSL
ncbi:MAG: hypothetical protein E7077_07230 [Bacteroidales bacterium]|jgi:hypothetical protein|nr:hypothetical protein [Bacteroidales bacterium]